MQEPDPAVVRCHDCGHPTSEHVGAGTQFTECDCCSWRKSMAPQQFPLRKAAPKGFPAEKWEAMPRRERRAIERQLRRRRGA